MAIGPGGRLRIGALVPFVTPGIPGQAQVIYDHVSTSFAERSNLTMRMSMRRFTRLTNGFSERFSNHQHAVALHFWHYNFARKHMTLKTTPAVATGIADRALTMLELVQMIEAEEARIGSRLTDYLPAVGSE